MYIAFDLPSGAAGMAAAYTAQGIRKQLNLWSKETGIKITEHRNHGYKFLVTLERPEDYTMFSLSFTGKFWRPWSIIDSDLPESLTVKNLKV